MEQIQTLMGAYPFVSMVVGIIFVIGGFIMLGYPEQAIGALCCGLLVAVGCWNIAVSTAVFEGEDPVILTLRSNEVDTVTSEELEKAIQLVKKSGMEVKPK